MFTSTTMQPKTIKMNTNFKPTNVPSQTLLLKPHKAPNILSFNSKTSLPTLQITKSLKLSASPTDSTLTQDHETPTNTKKLKVVVKPMQKPRIVLKMIWMDKSIGIALNQVIPGHGTIPLSPYYFWPKQDAWEQLKLFLEARPWISQRQMAILLNHATDIINLWQDSGNGL